MTTTALRCPACGRTEPDATFAPSARWGKGTSAYCRPCRAAYMRAYRGRRPDVYSAHQARNNARQRALTRLGRRHRAELDALIADELEREQ